MALRNVIKQYRDGYYARERPGWILLMPDCPELGDFSLLVTSSTVQAWVLEFEHLAPNTWWALNHGSAGPIGMSLQQHFHTKEFLLSKIR